MADTSRTHVDPEDEGIRPETILNRATRGWPAEQSQGTPSPPPSSDAERYFNLSVALDELSCQFQQHPDPLLYHLCAQLPRPGARASEINRLAGRPVLSTERTRNEMGDCLFLVIHSVTGREPIRWLVIRNKYGAVERNPWKQAQTVKLLSEWKNWADGEAGPDPHAAQAANVGPLALSGQEDGPLALIAGGFAYYGRAHDLTGRPRDMLEALLEAPFRRCRASDVRKALDVDDEAVDRPEQVVKDTAKMLRNALNKAVKDAGKSCENPLRSLGRGKDLTYILDVP
jgi:hypothetical protein